MDELNFENLSLNDNTFNKGDLVYYNNNYIIICDINEFDDKLYYGINQINDTNDYFIEAKELKYYKKINFNYNNLIKILPYCSTTYDEIDISFIKSWNDIFNII